jgi:acetyl esterase/lipase
MKNPLRSALRFLTPILMGAGFLLPASARSTLLPDRVDLEGRALPEAPNPTSPREGKPPAILSVSMPNLQLHRTSSGHPKGTILLFPGGAYHLLAIEHEGLRVAELLNRAGYDVAILEYSVGKEDSRSRALADATQALGLIRKQGGALGLHTTSLGIMGFSAGGHLAARLIHELGPDGPFSTVILIYPAYLEEPERPGGLDPDITVPTGLPARFFILIGDQDLPPRIVGTKAYAASVASGGRDVEFHLLKQTAHGFGIQQGQQGEAAGWPALLEKFLGGR